jgi:hypothetical protein
VYEGCKETQKHLNLLTLDLNGHGLEYWA